MAMVPDKGSPEHEQHMMCLAQHIMSNLFTWTGASDGGVNYGFERNGQWVQTCLSREEILALLDWPKPDDGEEWSAEVREYVWELLADVGAFIRTRCDLLSVLEAEVEIVPPSTCGHVANDMVWNEVENQFQCTMCGMFQTWP